jgi:hypothetical protein
VSSAEQPVARPIPQDVVPRSVHPVGTPGPVARPPRGELLGAVLKLASALCGLAAAGLFVLPLVRGEVSSAPRYVTLQPSFPEKAPPPPEAPPEAPQEEKVTTEERSDFEGAILMVESEPSGATILVDGKDQGETPVSVGLECLPGKPVTVAFSLRGYEKAQHRTLCPLDALVKVTARLRKSTGKPSTKK